MFTWIVIVLICTYIYWKLKKVNQYWEKKAVSQYKPWLFFGNFGPLFFQKSSLLDVLNQMYTHFSNKRYFGMYRFLSPALVIRDLNLIKRIVVKDFETFPEHSAVVPEEIDPLFSRNILFMKGGEKWQRLRSVLSPSFTSKKLKAMYPLMLECAQKFINHYEKTEGIVTLEIKDEYAKYTNDVIGSTVFGFECNTFEDPNNALYKMGKDAIEVSFLKVIKMFMYAISPTIMKLFKLTLLPVHVSDFFRKIVKNAMRQREEQNIIRPDLIHLLMETRKGRIKYEEHENDMDSGYAIVKESEIGKQQNFKYSDISDEDLVAQAVIFFLAGFDTSSTAMSFASYELAINPEIQKKLQMEIDKTIELNNGEFMTYEALLNMKYLDLVITETLRLWSPLSFVDRRAVKPFTIEPEQVGEQPIHCEAGTVCYIPIQSIHLDPKYYSNPKKFIPERFNDENKHSIPPFSYIPFGNGPKSCIGSRFALLETKLILCAVLSKFDIVTVPKTLIPMVTKKRGIFPAAEGGLWLGLKRRNILTN